MQDGFDQFVTPVGRERWLLPGSVGNAAPALQASGSSAGEIGGAVAGSPSTGFVGSIPDHDPWSQVGEGPGSSWGIRPRDRQW